ncbi:hypothetical protein ACOSQ4_016983 [Xanthoceras sorbifolium]
MYLPKDSFLGQGAMYLSRFRTHGPRVGRHVPPQNSFWGIVYNKLRSPLHIRRCKRFMAGLNPRIKILLSLALQTHYGELVEAAMKVERNATVITLGRPDNKCSGPNSSQSGFSQTSRKKSKTKWTGGKGTYRGATFSQGSVRSPAAPRGSKPTFPECSICKRRHPRECREGHFIKECPQLVTTKGSEAGTDTVAPTPSTGGPR